jgi:hypothetical protein
MCQRVSEFAAFVNRTRCLGRGMARNAARKAELLEQALHAHSVLRDTLS